MWDVEIHDRSKGKVSVEEERSKAIIPVPTVVQTDDSLVMMVHTESPNTAFHDILTHKGIGADKENFTEVKAIDSTTTSDTKEE